MTDQTKEQTNDSILFASKASRLIAERKIEDALELCEAGVREYPFYSPGHYTLALCYEQLGKNEDAKNEFERTLVYDPAHNRAMRKLSGFYKESGLDQLANELLIKEALYSPLDPEIIDILKEKDLYKQLNPESAAAEEMVAEATNDEVAEADIENEITIAEDSIQSIEEIEETEIEEERLLDEDEDTIVEEKHVKDEEEDTTAKEEHVMEEETTISEERVMDEDEETEKVEEETSEEEEEIAPIDNLDPLAGKDPDDDDDFIIDNNQGEYNEEEEEEDFSPLMQGYLEKDDLDDDDQWMEVENLLEGEEEISGQDVDPVPERPKNETQKLLEQLSNDENDDIDLEAGVVDPFDHIDLTSETDKSSIEADNLNLDDLTAGVEDPIERKKEKAVPEKEEIEEETEQDAGETISDIVSEFSKDEPFTAQDIELDDDEISGESEAENALQESTETIDRDEQEAIDDDDEVTIKDMLHNPNLVTPTFGEILIAQHKFSEARHVFVELSKKEPDNTRFMKKIQFLDKFIQAE